MCVWGGLSVKPCSVFGCVCGGGGEASVTYERQSTVVLRKLFSERCQQAAHPHESSDANRPSSPPISACLWLHPCRHAPNISGPTSIVTTWRSSCWV